MELLDLPNEMLEYILTLLDAKSLSRIYQTCKMLNTISNLDVLWQKLCFRDYKVSSKQGWNLSYKKIYTEILHSYPILGLKRLALKPYGGFMDIKWGNGEIIVHRIYPSDNILNELPSEPAYSITWDDDEDCIEVKCIHNFEVPAPAKIVKKFYLGQNDEHIPRQFTYHSELFDKNDLQHGYNCPLLPIEYYPTSKVFPMNPGFYRADYDEHGVEILQFKSNQLNPYVMECLKITGDPNVPAGNISFTVYLDNPIVLTVEDQFSQDTIRDANTNRPMKAYSDLFDQVQNGNYVWKQPFSIPKDFESDYVSEEYTSCVARFFGMGRIAEHNFCNSSLTDIHFVKFDDDTCGVLWLELKWFQMLKRETNIDYTPAIV